MLSRIQLKETNSSQPVTTEPASEPSPSNESADSESNADGSIWNQRNPWSMAKSVAGTGASLATSLTMYGLIATAYASVGAVKGVYELGSSLYDLRAPVLIPEAGFAFVANNDQGWKEGKVICPPGSWIDTDCQPSLGEQDLASESPDTAQVSVGSDTVRSTQDRHHFRAVKISALI